LKQIHHPPLNPMKVTFVDSKFRKSCIQIDDAASIKATILSMSVVPSSFSLILVYRTKILVDADTLRSICYSPDKVITSLLVKSAVVGALLTAVQQPSAAPAAILRQTESAFVPVLLQEGCRVRIHGLQTSPEMNGRTGVICSAFDEPGGRWTVQVDADSANPPIKISVRPRNLEAARSHDFSTVLLREGCRVRIHGLQTSPEMNGRTGVICSAFDEPGGRWTVQVDADSANPPIKISVRPRNLEAARSHDFSTEWLDEHNRVCPKQVAFARACPKGHALAARGSCAVDGQPAQLMCRICHATCPSNSHDAAAMDMPFAAAVRARPSPLPLHHPPQMKFGRR
jgi:hypothetical protein